MTRRGEFEQRRKEHIVYVASAIGVAMKAHMGQKYGKYPYVKHLIDVVVTLSRFGFRAKQLLAAAWLHDTLEDTQISHREILKFGRMVYGIVSAVTNETGESRKERSESTYLKIRQNENAITVKLADRIANIEESIRTDGGLLNMYQKEYLRFREALFPFSTWKHGEMWEHLDNLIEKTQERR